MSAFWELSSTRNFGWVIGPIPWTAMVQYAHHHHLEPDMINVFIQVMRELDDVYIRHNANKQRQKMADKEES